MSDKGEQALQEAARDIDPEELRRAAGRLGGPMSVLKATSSVLLPRLTGVFQEPATSPASFVPQ